jgi:hypothetical protein
MLTAYLFLQRKRFNIKTSTCCILGALSVICLTSYIAISSATSKNSLFDGFYTRTFLGAVLYAFQHPFTFISAAHKQVILRLLAPVLFLPLFSWEVLLGLPGLFQILLTESYVFQRANYLVGLIVSIFIGTIFVISKFPSRPRLQLILVSLVLIGCALSNCGNNIIGSPWPPEAGDIRDTRFISTRNIYDPRFYIMDDDDKIAWKFIKMIPPEASVSVSGDLLAALSSRAWEREFLFDPYDYYDVDYILLHNKYMYIGAGHYAWDDERMKRELSGLLANKQWKLLMQENEFYLFKRIHKGV